VKKKAMAIKFFKSILNRSASSNEAPSQSESQSTQAQGRSGLSDTPNRQILPRPAAFSHEWNSEAIPTKSTLKMQPRTAAPQKDYQVRFNDDYQIVEFERPTKAVRNYNDYACSGGGDDFIKGYFPDDNGRHFKGKPNSGCKNDGNNPKFDKKTNEYCVPIKYKDRPTVSKGKSKFNLPIPEHLVRIRMGSRSKLPRLDEFFPEATNENTEKNEAPLGNGSEIYWWKKSQDTSLLEKQSELD
jgi:hypothetical protein